jgi:anti-sigma factor RsiW
VTATCKDLEVLVSLRAAGALEPAEEARVEEHLAHCRACRAEAAAAAEVLGLARLAPPSDAVRRAVAEVPARAVAEVRRETTRRRTFARRGVAIAAAVAAALMVSAPALLQRDRPPLPPAAAEAAWREPDLDRIWEDTAILELTAAADEAAGDDTDAALAALETEDGT